MKVPVLLYEVDECEPALASQTSQYFCARSEIGLTVGCKVSYKGFGSVLPSRLGYVFHQNCNFFSLEVAKNDI